MNYLFTLVSHALYTVGPYLKAIPFSFMMTVGPRQLWLFKANHKSSLVAKGLCGHWPSHSWKYLRWGSGGGHECVSPSCKKKKCWFERSMFTNDRLKTVFCLFFGQNFKLHYHYITLLFYLFIVFLIDFILNLRKY